MKILNHIRIHYIFTQKIIIDVEFLFNVIKKNEEPKAKSNLTEYTMKAYI